MAEALAFIGLAGNIVQFIDAGCRIVSLAQTLYRGHCSKQATEIEIRSASLQACLRVIEKGPDCSNDKRLYALVKGCSAVAKELEALINKLKGGKSRALEATWKSIKTMGKHPRIDELESRLIKMRDALCFHLTHLLREDLASLPPTIKDLTTLTQTFRNESNKKLNNMMLEITQAIAQNRRENDKLNFKLLAEQLHQFVKQWQDCSKTMSILRSLHFKQIKERHSDVSQAHRNTFEWVFNSKSAVNFATWLQSGDGIFWITGKAGAGKSTLMKFIQGHPLTTHNLHRWAGKRRLIIASHYFWSAGTRLQKSQDGLLRTLLFQILAQTLRLLLLFAQVVGTMSRSGPSKTGPDLNCSIVPRLLSRVLSSTLLFAFSLMVLTSTTKSTATTIGLLSKCFGVSLIPLTSKFALLVVRGKNLWTHASSQWKIQVHELTQQDIRLFVRGKLMEDENFQDLYRNDRTGAEALVQKIQTKAQGAFLWVYLVVRSLIRGLIHGDEIVDLHHRVSVLPAHLEKYFELMLDRIESVYRQQTARIFQVMLNACATVPILTFHFKTKEEQEPGYSISLPTRCIPNQELANIINIRKRQLNARCKDLLHITEHPDEPFFSSVRVGFLHRTVMGFLRTKDMGALLATRSGTAFDADECLSRTYLAMFKAFPHSMDNTDIGAREMARSLALGTIFYAKEVENLCQYLEVSLLDSLDKALCESGIESVWNFMVPSGDCDKFIDIAARFELNLYVQHQLDSKFSKKDSQNVRTRLLWQTLRERNTIERELEFETKFGGEINLSTLEFVLRQGANPNSYLEIAERSHLRALGNSERYDMRELVDKLTEQHPPEERRSLWADFLLQLRTDIARQTNSQWDLNKFLHAPTEYELSISKNTYEACEFLIKYGASRYYQKTSRQDIHIQVRDLIADDMLQEIFPESSTALCQFFKNDERDSILGIKIVDETKVKNCIIM